VKEYDKLCEKYMLRQVRSFYPRKLEFSPEFLEAFKAEYTRLVESGQNKRTLLERMKKALAFHL
jgi:predicted ATP-dependent endonuclease of OLD family